MEKKLYTCEYSAPAHWERYLFTGDTTGLDEYEINAIEAWLDWVDTGYPVSIGEYLGRVFDHDAEHVYPYLAESQFYCFYRP